MSCRSWDMLESESVHIFREVAATIEKPALLFSGGKDSVVMLHLALKAFWPAPVPFPMMHVDTGENFDEVITFRDRTVEKYGLRLIVASVQEDIDAGRSVEDTGPRATRNRLKTVTLLRGIHENQFRAVFGGARRDEEKARAKERVFSFRDEYGSGIRVISVRNNGICTTAATATRVPQLAVRLVAEKCAVTCGNAKKPSDGACH